MSGASKTRDFFENGTSAQFEWVLGLYDQALKMKAESKSSKPENVIKLDKWYQNELPKKIKARGKEAHMIHDELVQTIKWKLARGKFQANMVNLIQMNTPRVVMQETKKAFRNIFKRGNLESAAQALCNLKGVGPTMASAVLAAGAPHLAPFMADECLLAMPDGEALDYTMKEYMRFVEYTQNCVDRLKSQGGDWTPHKVELAVWTHFVINETKPEMLMDIPARDAVCTSTATSKPPLPAVTNGGDTENCLSTSDEESKTALSAGEDSVSSPPQMASAEDSTGAENGNGNHYDESCKTNGGNGGGLGGDFSSCDSSVVDENSVPDLNTNGSSSFSTDHASSYELSIPMMMTTNGKENGSKDIPQDADDSALAEAPSIQNLDGDMKRHLEEDDSDQPTTKKLKPEEEDAVPEAITETAPPTAEPTATAVI